MARDKIHLEELNVIMGRGSTGFFEPIAYDVSVVNGEVFGTDIVRGSFIFDFIMFIRYSERKEISSGKNIGQFKEGFLDLFQWIFALKALGVTERMTAEKLIGVFSRQS